jgi:hypothetical protein
MGSNVFLIDDLGGLNPLDHTSFEKEWQLDSYVENYPQLLASALSTDEEELRFVLLERQAAIDDSDAGRSGRWAADAIFLDQTGTLTIVEDKLSHNPEIRRKMVGQMIEYVANLLDTFTVDGVHERLAQTHEDIDAAIARLLGEPELVEAETNSTEALWSNVERNLQAGAIRMVFVADRLPHELRRIIEFLNQYMNPMEIVGVQISRMRDGSKPGGAEVIVTSVIGRTERRGKVSPQPTPTPVSREVFFQDFAAIGDTSPGGDASRCVAEKLFNLPELLDAEIYRTPKAATKAIFRSIRSQRKLVAVYAHRRMTRCMIVVKYKERDWGWPDEMVARLEGLLGFRPTNVGREIGDWCAKSVENADALVKWVCEEARKD